MADPDSRYGDATGNADRIFGAQQPQATGLGVTQVGCDLRSSLTHPRKRALRYSGAPSRWTTWPPNLWAGLPAAPPAQA